MQIHAGDHRVLAYHAVTVLILSGDLRSVCPAAGLLMFVLVEYRVGCDEHGEIADRLSVILER
jgi:hypothetical protein